MSGSARFKAHRRPSHPLVTAALCAAAAVGACCIAVARAQGGDSALAALGLLPLIVAITSGRPIRATCVGAVWGAALVYLTGRAGADVIPTDGRAGLLLALVPAAYALLASLLTRAIGIQPLLLAAGWVLVELATLPFARPIGLLAPAVADGGASRWLAAHLGYAFIGLVLVLFNACLIKLWTRLAGAIPSLARDAGMRAASQVRHWIAAANLRPPRRRGPIAALARPPPPP